MYSRSSPIVSALRYVALFAGAFLMLAPFLYMIGTSFKPHAFVLELPPRFIPSDPTWENYIRAINSNNFGRYFLNSLLVATSSTMVVVMLSSLLAYAFARWDFPGRQFLFYTMLGTMMIPTLVLIIPQFVLAKNLHLLDSLWGLVVVYSAGTAFNMFLLRGFFEEIPQDLFDAATIDGAGAFRTFWSIALPLARPALAAVAIFSFLGAWDEFTWALTAINNQDLYTLPIALRLFQQQHGTEWGVVFAASSIAVLPTILVFVIFQRHFIKGITSGAIKG
ncbi:MAG TPA: carbohydrate ABC transporter permease [Chloroflexia bacterium]|nr:carbohydrate ABC transporter permease [Chloroflexia bacterium]